MGALTLRYFVWHYSRSIGDFFRVWSNFFWFFFHFFSIGILAKTLFSPLNRLDEQYKKGLYPSEWFETFIVNSLMRIVGAFVRLIVILIGLVALMSTAVFGLLFLAAWLLAPVLVVVSVIGGIAFIAS